jgi:hypothetical protein
MASGGRGVEVVTAVFLGLVSVATAVGAWQASVWNSVGDELARDAQDALDVSVNYAVLGEYARRFDTEASAQSVRWAQDRDAMSDPLEQGLLDLRINGRLGSTTPGFAEAWQAWSTAGYPDGLDPLADAAYLVQRDGPTHTYGYISRQLTEAADQMKGKSGVIARAAIVHALALFLFGISSIGRLRPIRYAILTLGAAAFTGGLVLWIMAY